MKHKQPHGPPMTLGNMRREKGGSIAPMPGVHASYQARPGVPVGEGRVAFFKGFGRINRRQRKLGRSDCHESAYRTGVLLGWMYFLGILGYGRVQ